MTNNSNNKQLIKDTVLLKIKRYLYYTPIVAIGGLVILIGATITGIVTIIFDEDGNIVITDKNSSEYIQNKALESIQEHEGYNPTPYPDMGGYSVCTGHYITNGDMSVRTDEECKILLEQDIQTAIKESKTLINNWEEQPWNVRAFLIEFTYQLGLTRAMKFKNFLNAIEEKNYSNARDILAKSKMADQLWDKKKNSLNGRMQYYLHSVSYTGSVEWDRNLTKYNKLAKEK